VNFRAFARLTRIEHALMLCVAVLAGQVMALQGFPGPAFALLSFVPPFMIEVAAFSINDYFDVEVDRRNRRLDRPLVSGEIPKQAALYLSIVAAAVGVGAAWFVNPACFAIALAFALASFLYSFRLKDMGLVGNSYVAGTMAVPFVYGNLSAGPALLESVALLSIIAFLAGLAREVMGAVRDVEGDRERAGAKTFPMLVGSGPALAFAAILYFAAIALSIVPFLAIPGYAGNPAYLLLVGACDAILAWVAVGMLGGSGEFLERARYLSLFAMALGTLAFLAGVFRLA